MPLARHAHPRPSPRPVQVELPLAKPSARRGQQRKRTMSSLAAVPGARKPQASARWKEVPMDDGWSDDFGVVGRAGAEGLAGEKRLDREFQVVALRLQCLGRPRPREAHSDQCGQRLPVLRGGGGDRGARTAGGSGTHNGGGSGRSGGGGGKRRNRTRQDVDGSLGRICKSLLGPEKGELRLHGLDSGSDPSAALGIGWFHAWAEC
mmetsp:Transcript_179883/g.570652  ORF Transcript_179883/g.570652 Transcript_179883/m.570652 type:complete len:206 (-) Transcript_179883:27-644(-)